MEKASSLEHPDPRLKPVFYFDKESCSFKHVEGSRGLLYLPKLPTPIDPNKTTVVEVRGHLYYKQFKTETEFSRRTKEGLFKQQTNLDPKDALLVEKIPLMEARGENYQIVSEETLIKSYKIKMKEREEAARGIIK